MEEDFLHQGAPSRLDYLKTSLKVEREGGPRGGREEGREEGKRGGVQGGAGKVEVATGKK
jgi:hypothetical protein